MKLFLAAILASAATTVAGLTPENLLARWDMNEPNITFNASANMFTLTFANISRENKEHLNMQEEFYDVNCKDDGSGFDEKVKREYFRSPDGNTTYPYMEWKDTSSFVELDDTYCTNEDGNNAVELYHYDNNSQGPFPIGFDCLQTCKERSETDLVAVTFDDNVGAGFCYCIYGDNSDVVDSGPLSTPTPDGIQAVTFDSGGYSIGPLQEFSNNPNYKCWKLRSSGDVQLQFVMNYTAMSADTDIYGVVGEDPDSCALGAQYELDFEAYFNVTEPNVALDLESITWKVVNETNDNIYGGTLQGVEANSDGSYTFKPNAGSNKLCRGVDYTFVVNETGGTNYLETNLVNIKGFYNSRDTDDLVFDSYAVITKTGAENGFNATLNFPLNPSNPATDISGKDGMGMLKFCVRSALGYDGVETRKLSNSYNNSLEEQIGDGFREVNFIESLLTVFFNLEAGFDVTSFNVEPKERIETTAAEDQYTLEAWLCPNVTDMDVTTFPNYNDDKEVPKRISESFLANFTGTKTYFNQGALISVCVAPDNAAWTDGIRMNGITKFDWIRNDLSGDEQSALTSLNTQQEIEQSAIENGNKATNGLTSYERNTCEGAKDFCTFASILFADFYISQGAVSGIGSAKLAFKTSRRRLGEPEGRELQNDPGAASPFDVNVPVDLTDTGPGSLKTAGGSSFGIGTFTFTMALLGAVLLA